MQKKTLRYKVKNVEVGRLMISLTPARPTLVQESYLLPEAHYVVKITEEETIDKRVTRRLRNDGGWEEETWRRRINPSKQSVVRIWSTKELPKSISTQRSLQLNSFLTQSFTKENLPSTPRRHCSDRSDKDETRCAYIHI
jgi:hypothetical protein